jgi:phenylacetate-CoA ligase
MKDYKTTTLISTPGYALCLGRVMEEMNIHPQELNLKTGLFGSEPWSENLRSRIEGSLQIRAYDYYGVAELLGAGISYECPLREGLHINEDHFIPEVIDPKTLKNLGYGEEGELVFTTITRQGFPLIRYRTGDISSITGDRCACGRTLIRMKKVTGRTDDMIIFEGLHFFPSQVEEIISGIEGLGPHHLIILDRLRGMETIEIQVEAGAFDEMRELVRLKTVLEEQFETLFGIRPKITLVEPETLKRSEGKKKGRVIDKREK